MTVRNSRIVLTVGTFDLYHSGHTKLIYNCWCIAGNHPIDDFWGPGKGHVVIGLNSDEFVEEFKGKKPIYTYEERRDLLANNKYVWSVKRNTGGKDLKPIIEAVNPTLLVVGSDWCKKDYYEQTQLTQEYLDNKGIILCYIPYTQGISTTDLKGRILGEAGSNN